MELFPGKLKYLLIFFLINIKIRVIGQNVLMG